MFFSVNKGGTTYTPLYPAPVASTSPLVELSPDSQVESNGSSEDTPHWMAVKAPNYIGDPNPMHGWIESRFLSSSTAERLPLIEESFVRACMDAERAFNEKENAGVFFVAADYLLAWSMIETGMTNQAPDDNNDGADGPFAITDTEWQAYLSSGAADAGAGETMRTIPILHAFAAAYIAIDQMRRFSDLSSSAGAPDGPHVPSYLNVLHCQLLGPEVASAMQKLMADDKKHVPVDEVLKCIATDSSKLTELLSLRRPHLFDGATPLTVEDFFENTAGLLDSKLSNSLDLIKKYCPDLIPVDGAIAGEAPWFDVAEKELAAWKTSGFDKNSRIKEYFKATDSGITVVKPWCGAFVAYCLANAGEPAKRSIVKGSASAANWKSWGNTYMYNAAPNIPRGAIVVTIPLTSDTSGHVGFFSHFADAKKETMWILGGNQSGRVELKRFRRGVVAAVRWNDFCSQEENEVPPPHDLHIAVDDDVLTLARTLYGEARGEPKEGIEAVANVVMNRVEDARWPSSVREVCLQPKQFSCWNRNDPNRGKIKDINVGCDKTFDMCFDIARSAVSGGLPDRAQGATHYYASYISTPNWVKNSPNARRTAKIGGHLFYAGIA